MSFRSVTRMIAGVASIFGAVATGGLWFMSTGSDVMSMFGKGEAAKTAPAPAAPAPSAPLVAAPAPAASTATPAPELDRCTVNDPSPTALNVRSKPNGDVVGRLSNGVTVKVLRRDTVNNKVWLLIEPVTGGGATGWAFARFLDCGAAAAP